MTTARTVALLNLVFVAAAGSVVLRMYRDQRFVPLNSMVRSKAFLAAVAISVAVAYLDAVALGKAAGFAMNADKLETTVAKVKDEAVFRGYFVQPTSFESFVYVYDPAEAAFDSVILTMYKNMVTRASPRTAVVGSVFPDDPTKRMISVYRLVSGVDSYFQPRTASPDFLRGVIQLFLSPAGKSEEEYSQAARST
jgi:hypothetical protein